MDPDGAWIVRWSHWAAVPRSLRVTVVADISWAMTKSELDYVCVT